MISLIRLNYLKNGDKFFKKIGGLLYKYFLSHTQQV